MMNVMTRAWEIAKTAEKESGYKAVEFIAEALRMAWKEAKEETEMTEDEKIAALEAKGFKRWTKYGKDRLYIDTKTLLNIEVIRRNTGSIKEATMDGEEISHGQAGRFMTAKAYIDLSDWSENVERCGWYEEEIIADRLHKAVEAIA
jgi:hypothetical protein